MKAKELYMILEEDFVTKAMEDIWFKYMAEIKEFVCNNFQNRSIGVVCDFANEVNKVYTAVFPTYEVMEKVICDNVENAMLFVHHPSNWDIRKSPPFYLMDKNQLEIFKERNISVFCFHVPLDNFSKYSTSVTLANELGINIIESFASSRGAQSGVIGEIKSDNISDLNEMLSHIIKHPTKLYKYGEDIVASKKVGIIAGGGNEVKFVEEMLTKGVSTLITGITSEAFTDVHEFERVNKVNVIGGTHYSTEKFACMRMTDYFSRLGLESEFIEGVPILEDL
ncbi:Nif3-like dinuclear metal center hexameric protein [Clostridiaceae bacterium M8S5]|nr:Nif3-like dinuclear metal center hexameric protein [Clostridiaceae bacterium M8S5]